LSAKSRP
jgi:hypothetical protein